MTGRIDYLTPTAWAEGGYSRRKLRRKWPLGPAGIPIPRADRTYLSPGEKDLLRDIAKAALKAESDRINGDTLPEYCRSWRQVRSLEAIKAGNIVNTQIAFRQAHGRQPTWGEIEAQYPVIASWLADQRRGIRP